jgi:hypothetical protein
MLGIGFGGAVAFCLRLGCVAFSARLNQPFQNSWESLQASIE